MRSAYSSVSNRDTSFSRIVRRFILAINSRFYPVIRIETTGSDDRAQARLGHAGRPVPGEVEEFRVGLLSVEDHGTVQALDVQHGAGEVRELRGARAPGRHEAHEDAAGG